MYLTIDIGGTFTKYTLFNSQRKEVADANCKIETKEPIDTINFVVEKVINVFPVDKVGISVAANINSEGYVVNSTNLKFPHNFSFVEFFKKKWGIECRAVNDADAAALGLTVFKEFSEYKTFVGVTLGTGVGGGLVIDGKLLQSIMGFAGEIGHIIVVENGLQCGCGKKGCVEAYCGAKGIGLRYKQLALTNTIISPKEINKLANSGDKNAIKVIKDTGELLGKVFAIISDIISPEAFVLTGGITGFGDTLLKPIELTMRKLCFSRVSNQFPKVLINRNGNSALLGALLLFDN